MRKQPGDLYSNRPLDHTDECKRCYAKTKVYTKTILTLCYWCRWSLWRREATLVL